MAVLDNLQPKLVFKYFEEISQIPRGSGNEKGVSDYLLNFGKSLGLESIQDEALNIIIKKPATKGYENAPTVILQGHMDMVCEKNKGTNHDFEKDPLKLRIVDDYIYATDTTLGADNGIAVAYAMAILASDDVMHPALEVLITTDEETGMSGAMAVSPEHINGKILINLDNEEEGYLLVSCAGGIRTKGKLPVTREERTNGKAMQIKISGLKGGHSGMDIIKERGNSNKILGRILKHLLNNVQYSLCEMNGGSKNNAIPREAEAVIMVADGDLVKAKELVLEFAKLVKNELKAQDAGLNIEVQEVAAVSKVFTKESTEKAVNLLYLYPSGINSKSTEIEGLVESSTNLGVLTTTECFV